MARNEAMAGDCPPRLVARPVSPGLAFGKPKDRLCEARSADSAKTRSTARLLAFRARWAGTIQDVCGGIVIALIIAVAVVVLP
jgi:hypothetical protein